MTADATHAPLIATAAASLAAIFDGVVEDGELQLLEGAHEFAGVAYAAVDDVAYLGTFTMPAGDLLAVYGVDAAAKIALPPQRDASSSPPEELSAGGTARSPEAGENVLGETEIASGAVTNEGAAPDASSDEELPGWVLNSRAALLDYILDLAIEHPSRLWRGFRQRYFNREHVEHLVDLDLEVLTTVAREATVFASQIPTRRRR